MTPGDGRAAPGRRWTRVCHGLLVDDSILAGSVDASPVAEPIGDRVAVGIHATPKLVP